MQGSNGNTDIINRLVDTVGEGDHGTNGEIGIETYTLPYVKQITNGSCMMQGTQSWCCVTTWRDRVGREVGGGLRMK